MSTQRVPRGLLPSQEAHWELVSALRPDAPGAARLMALDNRFVEAPLDLTAMRTAVRRLLERNEMLRMLFSSFDPAPDLRIVDDVEPPVEYADLSGKDEAAQDDWIDELVFEESMRTFDIAREPAWHAWCVRLGPDRFFVNVSMSEIISDGWTTKALVEDLLRLYAGVLGLAPSPPPTMTLDQMHEAQARALAPLDRRLEHWRTVYSAPPPFELFTANISDDTPVFSRAREDARFSSELLAGLASTAWRARTTPYIAMMAGYHWLLSALIGRERTVLSTVTLGRLGRAQLSAVMPCTLDTFVCVDLPGGVTPREAVRRTDAAFRAARENVVPYTALGRTVHPAFDQERPWLGHLSDANFYSAAFGDDDIVCAGLRVRAPFLTGSRAAERSAPKLRFGDIDPAVRALWEGGVGPTVEVWPDRDGCSVIYNPDVTSAAEARAHIDAYSSVLDAFAFDPDTPWLARGATHRLPT